MAIILGINSGSSSVKISVYQAEEATSQPKELVDAQISGLTAPPTKLKYTRQPQRTDSRVLEKIESNQEAYRYLVQHCISDDGLPQLKNWDSITHVCHRVVHGGDYPAAQVIDNDTLHHLRRLTDLGPLHNATALAIIESCLKDIPDAKNIAYFDTTFHASIPDAVRTYAIDLKVARKNKLRKYGFHGLSYSFITRAVAAHLHKPVEETNIIALHLGSGASACAIRNGESLDTSMGLTPVTGLPGATRSGDVDPSLMFHFTHNAGKISRTSSEHLHISTAEEILNEGSGWKSLTGTTDFGHITSNAKAGDQTCQLATDMFIDRITGYIGSYFLKLSGQVDALVFAGGIGEKAVELRAAVIERCRCLSFGIDQERNAKPGEATVQDISCTDARSKTLICKTDEQFEMARQCAEGSFS
ncbi:MAG: hypothetical protein LQ351_004526 [Letrouitia transgressa]|nr:MAG: hypothetical protein LQ351_004526 [Letrouitia transgressa]